MTTYKIITDKMVYGGDCIAKIDGKTVFVSGSLPGEKLEVSIVDDKKDYCTAKIINILEASPYRTQPFCPLYGTCGGCNMQHIIPEYQIELRKNILKDAFVRAGIDEKLIPQVNVVSGNPQEYRCRFQLNDGGMKGRGTSDVIPVTDCPIAVPLIRKYLQETPFDQRPKGRVHLFADDNRVIVASEQTSHTQDSFNKTPYATDSLANKSGNKQTKKNKKLLRSENKRKIYTGTVQSPENICSVTISPGKTIHFDARGFFQSNIEVLSLTAEKLRFNMGGENLLDMYSGAGTLSVFLADRFKHTTLVEHNRDALVFAEQNMIGFSHTSYGMSGQKWINTHPTVKYDAVVIDPPRSGMESEVRSWLCNPYGNDSKIPQIRSLSCDPATHARDASFLLKAGYVMTSLYLLDFYPQTSHIESLACFEYLP